MREISDNKLNHYALFQLHFPMIHNRILKQYTFVSVLLTIISFSVFLLWIKSESLFCYFDINVNNSDEVFQRVRSFVEKLFKNLKTKQALNMSMLYSREIHEKNSSVKLFSKITDNCMKQCNLCNASHIVVRGSLIISIPIGWCDCESKERYLRTNSSMLIFR